MSVSSCPGARPRDKVDVVVDRPERIRPSDKPHEQKLVSRTVEVHHPRGTPTAPRTSHGDSGGKWVPRRKDGCSLQRSPDGVQHLPHGERLAVLGVERPPPDGSSVYGEMQPDLSVPGYGKGGFTEAAVSGREAVFSPHVDLR